MAYFFKESARLCVWLLATLTTVQGMLGNDKSGQDNNINHHQHWGVEPGDAAPAFRVPTLDGEFSYSPGSLRGGGALVIHAFTHKSGFLECMWTNESSLAELVRGALPDTTHVLFLSMDDSAAEDALWMRGQVYRAALRHGCQEPLHLYTGFKGPVCTNNESVQGRHVGFYMQSRFELPVCERVVVEVKT